MEHLTRTRVDRFSVEDSLTLDQLEQLRDQGELESCILPVEEALQSFRPLDACRKQTPSCTMVIPALQGSWTGAGQVSGRPGAEDGQMFRMYDSNHRFTGVYQYQKDRHWWKPWKMFPM